MYRLYKKTQPTISDISHVRTIIHDHDDNEACGSDMSDGDDISIVHHLDHNLTLLEDDHKHMETENTTLIDEGTAHGEAVKTTHNFKNRVQVIIRQRSIIITLRNQLDDIKQAQIEIKNDPEKAIEKNAELQALIKELRKNLIQAQQRELELEHKHKEEIEKMSKELELLGKENGKLKKMIERLNDKLKALIRDQAKERLAQKHEREDQDKHRRETDHKLGEMNEQSKRLERSTELIMKVLNALKLKKPNTGKLLTT